MQLLAIHILQNKNIKCIGERQRKEKKNRDKGTHKLRSLLVGSLNYHVSKFNDLEERDKAR